MPHSTKPLDSGGARSLALRNQGERSTKAFQKTIEDFREFACIAPSAPPLIYCPGARNNNKKRIRFHLETTKRGIYGGDPAPAGRRRLCLVLLVKVAKTRVPNVNELLRFKILS
jgi:hypothetical protein